MKELHTDLRNMVIDFLGYVAHTKYNLSKDVNDRIVRAFSVCFDYNQGNGNKDEYDNANAFLIAVLEKGRHKLLPDHKLFITVRLEEYKIKLEKTNSKRNKNKLK